MSTEQLSIAYVLDSSFKPGEGVSRYMETLGNYYSGLGHEVNYIVGSSTFSDPSIHVVGRTLPLRVNGNSVDLPLPVPRARVDQTLAEINPDILHVQMPYSPFLGARFIKRASSEVGAVGTHHILPLSNIARIGSRLVSLADRPTSGMFDRVISVSPPAKDFARQVFGIDSEVIPCPIDLSKFREGQKMSEYDDGRTNIVFMGRLVERKGCQHLLKALSQLDKKTRSNLHVLIAGKGPLLGRLKQQTRGIGLEGIVDFVGFIDDERQADFLASADVAVFPSTGGESFGIVLAEAIASGAGVVLGGNNPGYSYVLEDDPYTLFDPHNEVALATRLKQLIVSKELMQSVHEQQQRSVERFDISVVGDQVLEVYKSALQSKTSSF
jgi:phosphatidylinositol alpha-mannosyltransferase